IHLILTLILVLFLLPGCGGSGVEIEEPEIEGAEIEEPEIEVSEADTYRLPDTGQETCYDNTTGIICGSEFDGQDAHYTINPLSYTSDTDTVTDNNTGLIWQRQDDDTTRDYNTAVDYCNNSTLGSQSDWRLPDKKELASIVNYGKYPAIHDAFSETKSSEYWSSTTYANDTSFAWSVSFSYLGVVTNLKTNSYFVRCVRGQVSASTLEDQGDSTVLDKKTRLVWQQDPTDGTFTWEAAISYCEDLALAGNSDWRLPNARELESITYDSTSDPAIDETYFEETNPPNDYYWWSSTTSYSLLNAAWYVSFNYGAVGRMYKTDSYYVRCVRSGQ
ncbi:MAG: DUF1566 domain-containing protein, partial [Deltaproteobacteria bacterium]|nr:DUF1566 domain-containing protein [Deltaproteobacteria bacterium]